MPLDSHAAYLALKARDARFDGRLFVGVTSTGVYCRPVCRVRTPRLENCRFFDSAAQAEAASFRPCMKCRPEMAPGPGLPWTAMDASRTLARQAAQWLDTRIGRGNSASIKALSDHLGVGDRHLRRIFSAEHGVTPSQYLQTRRLLLAKQLLTDTPMPLSQVACASGFASRRSFNAAFAKHYKMCPTRLRAPGRHVSWADAGAAFRVTLAHRMPCDAVGLVRFIGQRAIPGVESSAGLRIRRSLRAGCLGSAAGWVEAEFLPATSASRPPVLRLTYAPELGAASSALLAAARRWLDLDVDPDSVDAALIDLPGPAGLRLPGSIDTFEMAVRAVLGQQVSVAAARTWAGRLVGRFGAPAITPWPEVDRFFPGPETLGAVEPAHIASLGIVGTRAKAIVALASQWPAIAASLTHVRAPDPLIAALCELPGIGPWTAHYIAMRALSWPDAFPPGDLAVLKAMQALYGPLRPRELAQRAEAWRPWRSYAVLRLWGSLAPAAFNPSSEPSP